MTDAVADIRIEGKAHVPSRDIEHARSVLENVIRPIADQVVSAKALLADRPTHDVTHRAQAEASLNIKGNWVRAHTTAPTIREAIDALEPKLRDQLRHRTNRDRQSPIGRPVTDGEWRHGNRPSSPTLFFDRPVDDRELVRHKTFATPTSSVEEAAWDMAQLDYDFFLFFDEADDSDAVTFLDDGKTSVRHLSDAPELEVVAAVDWLNTSGDRFVFFKDLETNRGAVVYRRYDGNYGLLTPR